MLAKRVKIVDRCLRRAGLCLATNKTKIIASSAYKGPRKVRIGEDVFEISGPTESIRVLGLSFSFDGSPSQQAQELLARTRAAAASHRDLLCATGSWKQKMFVLKMLVESRFAWAAGALHWSSEDLRCANILQLHTLRSAFRLRRVNKKNWVDWNCRAMRFLRSWLHSNEHCRWSEKILQPQFSLHGHWARRVEHDCSRDVVHASLPMRALLWRSTYWWRQQQSLSPTVGLRHPCRFYASNPERQLSEALGNLWHVAVQDRLKWTNARAQYVSMWDVKWSSGRQLALRF